MKFDKLYPFLLFGAILLALWFPFANSANASGYLAHRRGAFQSGDTWTSENATLSALNSDIIEYYKCEEGSGNLVGAVNAYNGADNNSVGTATGKYNNCRSYVSANNEFFSITTGTYDYAQLFAGKSYTFACWIKTDTASGAIWGCANDGGSWGGTYCQLTSDGYIRVRFLNSNSVTGTLTGSTDLTDDDWHLIVLEVNGANAEVWVDNVSEDSSSSIGVAQDKNTAFLIGRSDDASAWAGDFNGEIDEIVIWDTQIGSTARTALYNGHTGSFYTGD